MLQQGNNSLIYLSDNLIMNQVILYLFWAILAVILIVGIYWILGMILDPETKVAHGQNATPPKVVTSPPNPTPTTPNPNFQYLPQKAFVLPYAPENGIPNTPPLNSPLAPTPVQPIPVQQAAPAPSGSSLLGIPGLDVAAIAAAVGVYLKTRLLDKKTDKVEQTSRENSVQIAKGADVDQSIADQVYRNMSDGGASIHDKPEIKLENLSKNKQEATETASKA